MRGVCCLRGFQTDEQGLGRRCLLVRHRVLSNDLMDQYQPAYKAHHYPDLSRPLARRAFQEALAMAEEVRLDRLDGRRAVG